MKSESTKIFLTYRLLLSNILDLIIDQNLLDNFLTGLNKRNFRKIAYKAGIQGAVG